jgi:flagellar basal body rod protein FlgC
MDVEADDHVGAPGQAGILAARRDFLDASAVWCLGLAARSAVVVPKIVPTLRRRSGAFRMSSVSAIALSGMNAAQTSLQANAHNIANLSTPRFRREQVLQTSLPEGGVSTALTQSDVAGNAMETDMVGMLESKNAFLANLAVFRTSDRMAGALLDVAG